MAEQLEPGQGGAGTPPPEPVDKPIEAMTVGELAAAVRYHNWRYFSLASPSISDYAFDRLTRRLQSLAPEHDALAELVSDNSATGDKVFHDQPMLSLDKCYDQETLERWANSFEGPAIETPKIDGVAASLKYDARGHLSVAVTRGDGVRGEAFTANARHIQDIPHEIGAGPVEVRGEIYLTLSAFAALDGDFSNPRNTTAGAIKQKVPAKTADYGLSFFLYDVVGADGLESEMDKVAWAVAHGFRAVETRLLDKDQLQAAYQEWVVRRADLDFEIDGVVYKADDLAEQRRLGHTAHHPRYAIAYKFQGESGTSTLVSVEWSVSRTGAITPVAIIEPIFLSGASVTRCSLHNVGILRALGATLGATVVATRRGGVIPHIEAIAEPGDGPIEVPEACPSCARPTRVDGDFLFCSLPTECPDAVLGTLQHYAKASEIDGFGPKIVSQLVERGLLREPADFYRVTVDDLLPLERMGETLAQKLVGNIAARRQLPLATFLRSLGIQDLGGQVARLLAEQFRSLDRVLESDEAELAAIHGLGDVTAHTLVTGLAERAQVIAALREHVEIEDYAAIEAAAPAATDHPLSGASVVFTGKLSTMDRKTAQRLVREHGGSTPSGVSATLDLLVVGDDGSPLLGDGVKSSKHKKADKLQADGAPLRIITEAAFARMVSGDPAPGNVS